MKANRKITSKRGSGKLKIGKGVHSSTPPGKEDQKVNPPVPENEAERLALLRSLNILDTQPEQAFDDIVTLAASICNTPVALVTLVDENRQWFKANIGFNFGETPREISFCAHAILKPDDVTVVADVRKDPRFKTNPLVTGDPNIRFYAGAPLVTRDGFSLGTLCVIDSKPRRLTPDQLAALRALRHSVITEFELRRALIERKELQAVAGRYKDLRDLIEGALDRVRDGFVAFDPQMNYTYVNQSGGVLLGRKPEDLIGKNYWNEYPEAKGTPFADAYVRALETQTAIVFEDYYEPFDRWFENRIHPSSDGLSIFFTDITERRKAEEALREQERFISAIADTSPAIVYVYDMETQSNVYTNNGIMRILGYSPREVQAMGERLFTHLIHPDDLPDVIAFQSKILAAADEDILEIQYRMKHQDGGWRTFHSYERPFLRNKDSSLKQKIGIAIDITERKRAEEALRESEEKFSKAFHSNPTMLALATLDGNYVDVNQAYADFLGYPREEILGKSIVELQIISVEKRQKILKLSQRDGGLLHSAEVAVRLRDGSLRHILLSLDVIMLKGVPHRLSTLLDITERKRAEDALKASERRFRALIENGWDAFTLADTQGTILYASPSTIRVLGYTPEEFIGINAFTLFHPDDLVLARDKLMEVLQAPGNVIATQVRTRHKDGSWRWMEGVVTNLFDEPDVQALVTNYRDITERKRVEDELRASEARLRTVLEASPIPITLNSLEDGIVLYGNSALADLFGVPLSEIVGQRAANYYADPAARSQALAELERRGSLRDYEVHLRRPDGKTMWISLSTAKATFDGRLCVLSCFVDITVRKQAEEALRESEQRYRSIFQTSGVSIWEEDFSGVKTALDELRSQGVTDFRNYFMEHPGFVHEAMQMLKVVDVNEMTLRLYGAKDKAEFLGSLDKIFESDNFETFKEELIALAKGKTYFEGEVTDRTLQGSYLHLWRTIVFPTQTFGFKNVLVCLTDITARKQAESLQDAIYRISEAASKSSNLDELFRLVHAIIGQVMPAHNFYIALYDAENDLLSFPYYVDEVDSFASASVLATRFGRGMTEYIIRTGKPLLSDIANFEELERQGEVELIGPPSPIWLGAPLIVEGRTIGAMAMQDYADPNVYTGRELRMLEYVSGQVAKAIERTRLYEDIRMRNRILSALQEATLPLIRQRELSEVLQAITMQASQLLNSSHGYIYLVEPDEKEIHVVLGTGVFSGNIGFKLRQGEGVAGKVWQTAQPLNIQDYHTWASRSAHFDHTEFHAVVGVPLISGSRVIGVLGLAHIEPERTFSNDDVELLSRFAQLASIAFENARLYTLSRQELAERKMAEEALREAETKYRELVERLPVVVYTSELGAAGTWHYVSPQIESLLGFTPEEWMADPNLWYRQVHPDDRERQEILEEQSYARGEPFEGEYRIFTHAGREIWIRDSAQILPPREGELPIVQGVLVDITERKRAEEALHESEETTRLIIDTALDAVITIDQDGRITRWNDQAESTFGWKRAEAVGQPLNKLIIPPDLRPKHEQGLKHYLETGEGSVLNKRIEITAQRRDGNTFPVELTVNVLKTNDKVSFAAFVRDITERKQAEEALSKAHDNLERLVQERTVALSQANTLLQTMLDHVPDHIFFKDLQSRFIRNSKSQAEMLGLNDPAEVVGKSDFDFFPHAQQAYDEEQSIIKSGQPKVDFEEHVTWPDGHETWVSTTKVPLRDEVGRIVGTFGIARDITERKRVDEALRKAKDELEVRVAERTAELNKTNEQLRLELGERKQAEENLRAAETRYRSLVEQLPGIVYTNPAGDLSSTVYVSPQVKTFLGYTQEEWLDDPKFWRKVLHPEDRPRVLAEVERVNQSGELLDVEYRMVARDGLAVWFRDQAALLRDANGNLLLRQGLMIDITDRWQAEDALKSSETRYRLASRATNDAIWDLDMVNDQHTWNENVQSLFGYSINEASSDGKWWHEHIHPADRERVLSGLKIFYEGNDTIWADEYRFLRRDGSVAYITDRGYVERDINGKPIRMIGAMSDISARKLAEDQIRRRVDYLKALRIIDMTITASTDLHFSLQTILRQAISQLQVDAADILLLNLATHILEYSDGVGFYTKAIERSSVRIGEGYAGRAALERKMVSIHSLYESSESFARRLLLDGEDFTGYYGVPLIAKGEVKGVLEVFHRTHLEVDQEWVDFLEALAGQAGLAIDNATLFQNLQRSNLELGLAYESTLEGWSAALDLRDKETEGHTLRVTNLTLQLAEHMGLKEKDLLHIRRGALLHDIGKMGVPDRILLKPDNLTSEEWEIMKFHPAYAYEMLSRIEYLRPSLDIPYCHHEKWDGTGYPRGLKGDEIPLHARIFAVVDVYDALTSDRPYRSAWTKERTVEYIKSLSGAHFDPRVANAFLELLHRY